METFLINLCICGPLFYILGAVYWMTWKIHLNKLFYGEDVKMINFSITAKDVELKNNSSIFTA